MNWAPPPPPFVEWKPRHCFDCGKPHPSFNLDGGKPGTPWRCAGCNAVAKPIPEKKPFADDRQGSLL